MRSGILAAGSWIVDYVNTIDVYPEQDALANILTTTISNGGAPYNVLVDLAKLNAPFLLYATGLVGDDANGRHILSHCEELGINTKDLKTTQDAPTATTQVMSVKSTGRRTFFCQNGANSLLSPQNFDFEMTTAKHFHLGYLLLLAKLDGIKNGETAACEVLKKATSSGLTTSIDVVSEDSNRFEEIVRPALGYVDLCFMNEFEAERTTGITLRSGSVVVPEGLDEAAQALLELGVRDTAIIHFAGGAFALNVKGERHFQAAVRVPPELVASTVGSGDAFVAGFLYGFLEEADLRTCLIYAVCTAAACVLDSTSSGGVLPLEECLKLRDRWGTCLP